MTHVNRKAIKQWMQKHALEHDNGPALANAAMQHFKCEQAWMWDAAQEIHDIMKTREAGKRHG